jgi:hypothetical protein
MKKVIVISDKVKSGKSTKLMEWIAGKSDIQGFITPRVNNKMMFYDIKSDQYLDYDLEIANDNSIKMGRYNICGPTLNCARKLMMVFSDEPDGLFIIDEIGPLEIKHNKGYEPAFSFLLNRFSSHYVGDNATLIIVVRDFLLQDFMTKYGDFVTECYENFVSLPLDFYPYPKI